MSKDIRSAVIAALEDMKFEFIIGAGSIEFTHNLALDKAIDLINELIPADMVMVPRDEVEGICFAVRNPNFVKQFDSGEILASALLKVESALLATHSKGEG